MKRLAFFLLPLAALAMGPRRAPAEEPAAFATWSVNHELSVGGMVRVLERDAGLIGGGNGGHGTSVNFDDGNLNYGRGLTAFGMQGRSVVEGRSGAAEMRIEAVYFYDLVTARADTDFRALSPESLDRVARGIYVNDAYVGTTATLQEGRISARLGYQSLFWAESTFFGYSIAPLNPIAASRRYQAGNPPAASYVSLPMLSARFEAAAGWAFSGAWILGFRPSESEASGSFLSPNDYYSPGARFLHLGQGSPLVSDEDASVVTPVTPFGSKVPRAADREPGSGGGQFAMRVESPEVNGAAVSGYLMRVRNREPIVGVKTGTLGGLLGITAPDYTSSGNYFVEYVPGVTIVGASARFRPATYTRIALDYSLRLNQPLQVDDEILITAGLAPAAAVAACTPNPGSRLCSGTLAALNANPLIAASGGITAATAPGYFATEFRGYERFDVSQYAVSVVQGLPSPPRASQWYLAAEIAGIDIHGFKNDFLDASVTSRPSDTGTRRIGLATRSAWGYRLSSRITFPNVLGLETVAPSLTWIHDVKGNAPITLGTFLEENKSAILAIDCTLDRSLSGRIAYRSYLGKGSDADRFTDRDFVAFSVTKRF